MSEDLANSIRDVADTLEKILVELKRGNDQRDLDILQRHLDEKQRWNAMKIDELQPVKYTCWGSSVNMQGGPR